jgi:hypothetical protein
MFSNTAAVKYLACTSDSLVEGETIILPKVETILLSRIHTTS